MHCDNLGHYRRDDLWGETIQTRSQPGNLGNGQEGQDPTRLVATARKLCKGTNGSVFPTVTATTTTPNPATNHSMGKTQVVVRDAVSLSPHDTRRVRFGLPIPLLGRQIGLLFAVVTSLEACGATSDGSGRCQSFFFFFINIQ